MVAAAGLGPAGWFLRWARGLRFPYLLALTAALFIVDLFIPDFIPFVDEILLGLLTIAFGAWRKQRPGKPPDTRPRIEPRTHASSRRDFPGD